MLSGRQLLVKQLLAPVRSVLGIMQLTDFSSKDGREKSEEREAFNMLKRGIYVDKIGLEEFEKKMKGMA